MNPAVSVIVPVYNVEKYLDRCLESLVNQTLTSLEIIVVNDGSKDQSQRIIDRFVREYPDKVYGYIKENGGLSDARNFGMKLARGEYLGFVDSDDYVEPDMYAKMLDSAERNDSDIVVCDLDYVWEDSDKVMRMAGYSEKRSQPIAKSIFLAPLFAWNKLYRKSLFDASGLDFPLGLWYEDIPVIVPLFALAKRISYVDQVMVHYLQRSTSIMGSKTNPKMKDIFDVLERVVRFYRTHQLFETYHDELEYLYIEHLMLYGSFRFMRSEDFASLMPRAFTEIAAVFPRWKKNPYLLTLKRSYRLYLRCLSPFTARFFRLLLERKDHHA